MPPDFAVKLDAVLKTPLTPENFANYGNDALASLIDLTDEVMQNYRRAPMVGFANSRDEENAAFTYFHLPDISRNLEFIAESQNLINEIRTRVSAVKKNPDAKIILPPDSRDLQIESGDGSFNQDKTPIPRTEMLMFLLANRFGVDLNDAAQFQISHGRLAPNAMRDESYSAISVNFVQDVDEDSEFSEGSDNSATKVSRLIFVCDASENSTFIINADVARELIGETFVEDLANLGKKDLRDLLVENPELGKSLIYIEKTWLKNLATAIENPQKQVRETSKKDEKIDLLIPPLGEGETTINKIRREFHTSKENMEKIIIKINFQSLGKRRSGGRIIDAYDEHALRDALFAAGIFREKPAKNEIGINGLATELSEYYAHLKKLINDIGIVPIGKRLVHTRTVDVYDRESLLRELNERGLLPEPASESETSIKAFARKNNTTLVIVKKLIEESNIQGHVKRSGTRVTEAYDELELMNAYNQSPYSSESANDGEISIKSATQEFGIADRAVRRAVIAAGLESVGMRKFNTKIAPAYDRQELLKVLSDQGYIKPAGTRPVKAFANLIKKSQSAIRTIIHNNLEDRFSRYNFGGRNGETIGLTLQDQLQLLDFLHQYKSKAPNNRGEQYLDDETYARVREQLLREQAELDAEKAAREADSGGREESGIGTKNPEDESREAFPRTVIAPSMGYGAVHLPPPEKSKND